MSDGLTETHLEGLKLLKRGKVRDIYDLGEALLIVATDRISAFDVVMPTPIPDKGKVLTKLSLFWFEFLKDVVGNHLITADVGRMPPEAAVHAKILSGRSMLVRKASVLPIECVARGYLAGSGWKEYREKGSVCGMKLPAGLGLAEKLPEVLFTPATKAETGHDENISPSRMAEIVGGENARRLRELTVGLYRQAAEYALSRGIIICDTKFEFGLVDGRIILVDEALTPDSSRFWPAESYRAGASPPSFDKQFVRDYLETLDWDKTPPGPELPGDVVRKTRRKYLAALELIAGAKLD